MIIVDAHCDTATRIMELGTNLYESGSHADLKRMLEAGDFVQFFAAFLDRTEYRGQEMRRAVEIIDKVLQQAEEYGKYMAVCRNYGEILDAFEQGKVAAILSIEEGEALQGELSALRMFHHLGVRSICLTWNHRNEIADGVLAGSSGGGLTPFGRKAIGEMNRLGMLIDVSHLSERGFWDVIELTQAPIIASHSNARAVCGHLRNLTDEQIMALGKNGGVMGINLYPAFLNVNKCANLDDIILHIEHIAALSGEDHIGLGGDFDGIETTPEGIGGVEDLHLIFERLRTLNYPERFIEKLAGGNFLRVIREVMK